MAQFFTSNKREENEISEIEIVKIGLYIVFDYIFCLRRYFSKMLE